jgi:hypothetical protein
MGLFSEFVYDDEEREVFFDHEGNVGTRLPLRRPETV